MQEKREWQPRELRLVSEYMRLRYPGYIHMQRVRVGELHPLLRPEELTEQERRMIGVFRRWVDGLVIMKRKMILIEGAILPDLGDVSKIEAYARLLPYTPELKPYIKLPIEKQLVFAIVDPFISTMFRERRIKPVQYRPKWIVDYIKTLFLRKQRAPLTKFW